MRPRGKALLKTIHLDEVPAAKGKNTGGWHHTVGRGLKGQLCAEACTLWNVRLRKLLIKQHLTVLHCMQPTSIVDYRIRVSQFRSQEGPINPNPGKGTKRDPGFSPLSNKTSCALWACL